MNFEWPKPKIEEPSDAEKSQKEKEEHASEQSLKINKKLDKGDIEKARDIFIGNFFGKDYDKETQILTEGQVIPHVKEKIIEDIVNKKGDELVQMIDKFSSYLRNGEEPVEFIKPDDLKQIPEDVLKAPEIIKKIYNDLIEKFKRNYNQPKLFSRFIETYSNLGFISKEEILRLPEIKEEAKRLLAPSIMDKIRYISPSSDELKKIFLELGLLDENEIEQARKEKQ